MRSENLSNGHLRSVGENLILRMDIAAPYKTCRPGSMSAVPLKADMHRHDGDVRFVPQAEVKRHAISCTTLNDIVQSLLNEVSAMARSGAPGIAGNKETVRTERGGRQRGNDVGVSGLARVPDRVS